MQKGKIVRLMDRGYGFIDADGQDDDLFFHSNELKNADFDSLKEGQAVSFEIVDGPKGPSAVNVNVGGGDDAPADDGEADESADDESAE